MIEFITASKGTYYYRRHTQRERQGRDAALKERIISIIKENPSYGYRRICTQIAEDGLQQPVNHKRIRRVLGEYELGLRRCLPKARPSPVAKLVREAGPSADLVKGHSFGALEAFSTDFTELVYDGGKKKAHLMVMLDIASKWAGGWSVGATRSRSMALEAADGLREEMALLLGETSLAEVIVHHERTRSTPATGGWRGCYWKRGRGFRMPKEAPGTTRG